MPSAAPWVSPAVNIPLYSIWLPSFAAANSDHCREAWKTAVLVLNRTPGKRTEGGGGDTILPALLMSVIFHFLIFDWGCLVGNSRVILHPTRKLTFTCTTCVSLLWHTGTTETWFSHSSWNQHLLHHFVVSCCRPDVEQLPALIMSYHVSNWLWWYSAQSAVRELCLFGWMWLNLRRLTAHGAFTVCLAHPEPLSTSKYYSSETRWFCLGWPSSKVKVCNIKIFSCLCLKLNIKPSYFREVSEKKRLQSRFILKALCFAKAML